jgi:hypothetical protein
MHMKVCKTMNIDDIEDQVSRKEEAKEDMGIR